MLCSCYLPGHPGSSLVNNNDYKRNQNPTTLNYRSEIMHLTPTYSKKDFKEQIKTIHTQTVQSNYAPNKVLRRKPPKAVHKDELEMPRAARSKLSQWRSSYSSDFKLPQPYWQWKCRRQMSKMHWHTHPMTSFSLCMTYIINSTAQQRLPTLSH